MLPHIVGTPAQPNCSSCLKLLQTQFGACNERVCSVGPVSACNENLGICVPTIYFLVSEMIFYRSLYDIIHVQGPARRKRILEAEARKSSEII